MIDPESSPRLRQDAPDFVERIYNEHLEAGFKPYQVVVEPDQPHQRIDKFRGLPGVYDYSTQFFPYTGEDKRQADSRSQTLQKLIEIHGQQFVKEVNLPDGYVLIGNYPQRIHRLVMVGPSEVRKHTDRALSDSPHSPSEAIKQVVTAKEQSEAA